MEKPKTFEQAIDQILAEMRSTMIAKQKDYGPGNISAFGEHGVIVRLNDKVERMKNLKFGNGAERALDEIEELACSDGSASIEAIEEIIRKYSPKNEPVEDTYLDTANYGLILLMLARDTWGLPMESK
jgi:hypothetical protein